MVAESIVLKTTQDCAAEEREAFLALVVKGGEVNPEFARAGIERAERLAFACVGKQLAWVACLKRPLNNYKKGVFEKTKSSTHQDAFTAELGYVSVDPDFQGRRLSSKLAEALPEGLGPEGVCYLVCSQFAHARDAWALRISARGRSICVRR